MNLKKSLILSRYISIINTLTNEPTKHGIWIYTLYWLDKGNVRALQVINEIIKNIESYVSGMIELELDAGVKIKGILDKTKKRLAEIRKISGRGAFIKRKLAERKMF